MKSNITLILCLISVNFCYSQKALFKATQFGISIIDKEGKTSEMKWSKSNVAIWFNQHKKSIDIYSPAEQNYNEVALHNKMETYDADVSVFNAVNSNSKKCLLILTRYKDGIKENQLRIIFPGDRIYVYYFTEA